MKETRFDRDEILRLLRNMARNLYKREPGTSGFIDRVADYIESPYHHADPCQHDSGCPCYAAGQKVGKPPLRYPGMRAYG